MKRTIPRTHRVKVAPKPRRSWPDDPLEKDPAQKRSPFTDPDALGRELTALSASSVEHLKNRWRFLYSTEPPKAISRELLTRAIAYRWQEHAFGRLKPSTRRLLERFAQGGSSPQTRVAVHRRTAPGTVLIREWQGRSHRVVVLDDGRVLYNGQRYQSLSEVARVITGTRWSGPLFFGLRGRTKEAGNG
jgi:Protein of unknown function (DUF2924)